MAKPKKLRLRGAEFREVLQNILPDKNCLTYTKIYCDITPEMAEEMGWEIYVRDEEKNALHLIGGLEGQTKLEGEIELEQIQVKLNGTSGTALECVASKAWDFTLTRKKSDTGDGTITRLRFELVSSAWQLITDYFGRMGQADGVLVLSRPPEQTKIPDAQQTLDEGADAAEDAESQEEDGDSSEGAGESRPGVLASATQMRKRGMRTQ